MIKISRVSNFIPDSCLKLLSWFKILKMILRKKGDKKKNNSILVINNQLSKTIIIK